MDDSALSPLLWTRPQLMDLLLAGRKARNQSESPSVTLHPSVTHQPHLSCCPRAPQDTSADTQRGSHIEGHLWRGSQPLTQDPLFLAQEDRAAPVAQNVPCSSAPRSLYSAAKEAEFGDCNLGLPSIPSYSGFLLFPTPLQGPSILGKGLAPSHSLVSVT